MARCRYCKSKVSYQAKACPKCGCPNPGKVYRKSSSWDIEEEPAYAVFALITSMIFILTMYFGYKSEGVSIMEFIFGGGAAFYFMTGGASAIIVGGLAAFLALSYLDEKKIIIVKNALVVLCVLVIGWLIFV